MLFGSEPSSFSKAKCCRGISRKSFCSFLRYAHSDSEYWDEGSHTWKRSLDRDYSILIYLNEGFEGGALFFPNFDYRIAPKRGMMIAFPSDHRYLHAAEPLISGKRFAVVSWAKARKQNGFTPFPE